MNFDNIPQELKQLPRWVVWKAVPRGDKVTKPPFMVDGSDRAADTTDPSTWGTYEEATTCYFNNPYVYKGIGFCLVKSDRISVADIDGEEKVKEEFLEERRRVLGYILESVNTYTEISPSQKGLHLIFHGEMPRSRQMNRLGMEFYSHDRFITMTGDLYLNRGTITDQQDFINGFIFGDGQYEAVPSGPVTDTDQYRETDLHDDQVLLKAAKNNPQFSNRYNAQADCGPGEWSNTFMYVVAELDRVSGSVEQVRRLVMESPMVTQAPPSGSRETRPHKANRIFADVMQKVRAGNNHSLYYANHGKQIAQAFERTRRERAEQLTREAVRQAEEVMGKLSSSSVALLDAFPQLATEHRLLTRPPGRMGEFVLATERASFKPFTKFAIPAAFASLAGITGRRYKLPNGGGINLNFILAAPSSSGKTQVMKAWERFMGQVQERLPATPSGPARSRLINSSTSSIQAMMEDFQERPSCVWFVEECASQLSAMSAGKTTVESALKDAFNQLYDCSEHGKMFSGPRSVSARKAQLTPINNLCVSTFWTTVPSKLELATEDALDGFLSRVIVVRHNEPGGSPNDNVEALPQHLDTILFDLMAIAQDMDDKYRVGGVQHNQLSHVQDDYVKDLSWEFVQTCDRLANGAIKGELPVTYTAISRLPLTAMRMAGVMAVVDNPHAPVITEEQLKWSFGYLLQNLVYLLSDIDQGKMGGAVEDDVLAVVRTVREMLQNKRYRKPLGISRSDLTNRLRAVKPFTGKPVSAQKLVTECLDRMVKEGQLERAEEFNGKPGRIPIYHAPTADPVWSV